MIREPPLEVFIINDAQFYQAVRVTKRTFRLIHDLIEHDRVFTNRSHCRQRAVSLQLAVALEWFGSYGNASSVGRIARTYNIGSGTVTSYVKRVKKALLRHYRRFVSWPSAHRRAVSSAYHRVRYGLPGAVGFVDGTHVILSQKPHVDGSLHYNRKSRYSINVQIVCDEDKRILMAYTGWPGSCHDSTVIAKTPIITSPEQYFTGDEYLVGDTGYALTTRLIVPYKQPAANSPENTTFNEIISSARVVNENCIGLIKNRWMSLKGVRTQIKAASDFKAVNDHVLTCVLLHNMAMVLEDTWYDDSNSDDEDDDEPQTIRSELVAAAQPRAGHIRREQVKAVMLRR
ncbi:hypothetical protein P43SY_008384 [Pythium insidiosum]|uniref:Putative nuclease HARBI1 n=1 Tax=Pythium insidiosum TaxID=114742 RepID=A0AAD5M3H3_PYTIN|nr:hypothetical protein P43SY_008384 [Pythium insidiosum]